MAAVRIMADDEVIAELSPQEFYGVCFAASAELMRRALHAEKPARTSSMRLARTALTLREAIEPHA
jgi:hypothetical protein